jgi:hypothetical protein
VYVLFLLVLQYGQYQLPPSQNFFFVSYSWCLRGQCHENYFMLIISDAADLTLYRKMHVLDPGKGVCMDPVKRGAILEGEGPGPPSGDRERQLSPNREGGKM